MKSKSLVISCWNVQGQRSSSFGLKSRTPDFIRELGDADVIVLQETWSRGDSSTGCPINYREIVFPSTKLEGVRRTETDPHAAEPSKLNFTTQPYMWTNKSKDNYQNQTSNNSIPVRPFSLHPISPQ